MAKPLSLDLRLRIAAALTEGLTARAAAKRFGVSAASAVRMGQLARSGKGLAARRMGGHRQPVLAPVCAAITARRECQTACSCPRWWLAPHYVLSEGCAGWASVEPLT